MGYAEIGTSKIRCDGFNMDVEQQPEFYDHIYGLRDIPVGSGNNLAKKDGDSSTALQQFLYRPGVKIVNGNISFPLDESNIDTFFDKAKTGDDFGFSFFYNCEDIEREFNNCRVSSYSLSCAAGDVVKVSAGITGISASEPTQTYARYMTIKKLVTWDEVSLTVQNVNTQAVSNFTLNIENPIIPIYTSGNNVTTSLNALKTRVGIQKVTGSITTMNRGASFLSIQTPSTISLSIAGTSFFNQMDVILFPVKRTANVGPISSVINFTAVGRAFA